MLKLQMVDMCSGLKQAVLKHLYKPDHDSWFLLLLTMRVVLVIKQQAHSRHLPQRYYYNRQRRHSYNAGISPANAKENLKLMFGYY